MVTFHRKCHASLSETNITKYDFQNFTLITSMVTFHGKCHASLSETNITNLSPANFKVNVPGVKMQYFTGNGYTIRGGNYI